MTIAAGQTVWARAGEVDRFLRETCRTGGPNGEPLTGLSSEEVSKYWRVEVIADKVVVTLKSKTARKHLASALRRDNWAVTITEGK